MAFKHGLVVIVCLHLQLFTSEGNVSAIAGHGNNNLPGPELLRAAISTNRGLFKLSFCIPTPPFL